MNLAYKHIFASDIAKKWLQTKVIVPAGSSGCSYCFSEDKTAEKFTPELIAWQYKTLQSIFQFKDTDRVFALFKQSATGKEARRINIIWSSALLPFLVFHSVDDECPLEMDLPGFGRKIFTRVQFEFPNHIKNGGGPSSVDVVLSNEEGEVLFLESKLAEYLKMDCTGPDELPCVTYGEQYRKLMREKWNGVSISMKELIDKKGRPAFRLVSDKPHYLTGIKQMISHYMGIRDNWKGIQERIQCSKAYLAEVLFDFGNEMSVKNVDPLDDYRNMHSGLVRHLSSEAGPINIVQKVLTYQTVTKGMRLPPLVAKFYGL